MNGQSDMARISKCGADIITRACLGVIGILLLMLLILGAALAQGCGLLSPKPGVAASAASEAGKQAGDCQDKLTLAADFMGKGKRTFIEIGGLSKLPPSAGTLVERGKGECDDAIEAARIAKEALSKAVASGKNAQASYESAINKANAAKTTAEGKTRDALEEAKGWKAKYNEFAESDARKAYWLLITASGALLLFGIWRTWMKIFALFTGAGITSLATGSAPIGFACIATGATGIVVTIWIRTHLWLALGICVGVIALAAWLVIRRGDKGRQQLVKGVDTIKATVPDIVPEINAAMSGALDEDQKGSVDVMKRFLRLGKYSKK